MSEINRPALDILETRFEREYLSVLKFFNRRLQDLQLAEDLTQTVFEALARTNPVIKESFKKLIVTCQMNVLRDYFRKTKTFNGIRKTQESLDVIKNVASGESVEKTVENNELRQAIKRNDYQLGFKQSQVIYLSFVLGLSNSEIAGETKMSEGAVRTSKANGIRNLKKRLK